MQFYLNKNNEKGFELSFLQIKQFYFDYSDLLSKSEKMEYFCGLYLMFLLSNNRTSDYCVELELLPLSFFTNDYITLPIEIEHCLSEGNYQKLLNIQSNLKDNSYIFFMKKFNSSIRYQIARSLEKSCLAISTKDACQLLMLKNEKELLEFIENENSQFELNELQKDKNWILSMDKLIFKNNLKDKIGIPNKKIVDDTLNLAIGIEKII